MMAINFYRYLYLCENVRPDILLFDQEVRVNVFNS